MAYPVRPTFIFYVEFILVVQHILDLYRQFPGISFIPIRRYIFKRRAAIGPRFNTPDDLVKAPVPAVEMIFSIVLGKNVVLFSQLKSAFGDAIGDASHDPTKMRVSSFFVILRVFEPKNDVIELAGIVWYLDGCDRRPEIGDFDAHAIRIAQGEFSNVRLINL